MAVKIYRTEGWQAITDEALRAELAGQTSLNIVADLEEQDEFEASMQLLSCAEDALEVNLSGSYFNGATTEKIITLLEALPDSATTLRCSDVQLLKGRTADDVIAIFKAIPQRISVLDVSRNHLGDLGKSLIDCVQQLSADMLKLDLSSNLLNRLDEREDEAKSSPNFVGLMTKIGHQMPKLGALYLNDNGIHNIAIADLKASILALPRSLTEMNFRGNNLHAMADLDDTGCREVSELFAHMGLARADFDGNRLSEGQLSTLSMFANRGASAAVVESPDTSVEAQAKLG